MPKSLITTSWDDGFPKDLKLAELLNKYNLPATFYIPKTNKEHVMMGEKQVLELSKQFEIGGHTLNHTRLYSDSTNFLNIEIKGCFDWLCNLLGQQPVSFCFPGGVIRKAAIASVYDAGFKVIRTTELLSTAVTSTYGLTPTTLQVFEHGKAAYVRNTVKRFKYKNLIFWIASSGATDILKLVDFYLNQVQKNGGCFHLWGHSWEIEEYKLWTKLELIFKQISGIKECQYVQNKALLQP